jgi:glycosyltransferase involved in cell wall biosynthesis
MSREILVGEMVPGRERAVTPSLRPRRVDFWVHDPEAPSFRHRLAALFPALEDRGYVCRTEVFPRRRYVTRVIERLPRLSELDLLVIAKLKLLPIEARIVRRAARRIVYDFDDAIYLGKPGPGDAPDVSFWRRSKFAATCRAADLVVAGSPVLGQEAKRWARRVAVVPTAVDVSRYATNGPRTGNRLVWIGQPGNLPYLELIRPVLQKLSRELPNLTLRVICNRFPRWPELRMERLLWSAATESAALATSDVGVMPLPEDAWAAGKGAFKLLQYMAAGLPAVASPIGMNRTVVLEGATGYLAADPQAWLDSLRLLLRSPEKRRVMGEIARRRVEREYDLRVIAPKVAELYEVTTPEAARSGGAPRGRPTTPRPARGTGRGRLCS